MNNATFRFAEEFIGSHPIEETRMRCPICEGRGEIEEPYQYARDRHEERCMQAKVLREAGCSLRQIAKALGYASPRSVVLALKAKDRF